MENQLISRLNPIASKFNVSSAFQKPLIKSKTPALVDTSIIEKQRKEIIYSYPKEIIDKTTHVKTGIEYHLNHYQGCENGCVYCYARKSHELFGYNAGNDFERKIIVKKNAVELLETTFSQKKWNVKPILLSGNTDCYQPIEKELEITRGILKTCLKYKHPISIITKNTLITRDLDILTELAAHNLVHVMISVTSYDEAICQLLEPHTPSTLNRMNLLHILSQQNIPCGIMLAPIIPGINNIEISKVLEEAALLGATSASMSLLRLNGSLEIVMKNWLIKHFPEKADAIWHQIMDCQIGKIKDTRKSMRIKDEIKVSESIQQNFLNLKEKYKLDKSKFVFNTVSFNYKAGNNQLSLF